MAVTCCLLLTSELFISQNTASWHQRYGLHQKLQQKTWRTSMSTQILWSSHEKKVSEKKVLYHLRPLNLTWKIWKPRMDINRKIIFQPVVGVPCWIYGLFPTLLWEHWIYAVHFKTAVLAIELSQARQAAEYENCALLGKTCTKSLDIFSISPNTMHT